MASKYAVKIPWARSTSHGRHYCVIIRSDVQSIASRWRPLVANMTRSGGWHGYERSDERERVVLHVVNEARNVRPLLVD